MPLSDEAFADLRAEWNRALPDIIAGKPDRTDLMIPLKRAEGGREFCTMDDIVGLVARETGVHAGKMMSRDRTKQVCKARFMAFFIANELRSIQSLGEIGRMMNRDHTTVSNALRSAMELRRRSAGFKASCESVLNSIGRTAELA